MNVTEIWNKGVFRIKFAKSMSSRKNIVKRPQGKEVSGNGENLSEFRAEKINCFLRSTIGQTCGKESNSYIHPVNNVGVLVKICAFQKTLSYFVRRES